MFPKNNIALNSNCKDLTPLYSHVSRLPDFGGHARDRFYGRDNHISCPSQVVNRSFDTLEINYKVNYLRVGNLFARLYARKELLLTTTESSLSFQFFKDDEFNFTIERTGKKFFPYCLRSGDIFVYMANRSCDSNIPNFSLKIGSITCNSDLENFFQKFREFFIRIGAVVESSTLSRVDICIDMIANIKFSGIEKLDTQISRSEKTSLHYSHKKLSGVSIGTGDISCRIYDKIQEMADKQDAVKTRFFLEKWQYVTENDHVTRCEFQLRRPALKEMQIDTFEQIKEKVDEVWSYLTRSWLRYASQSIDRKNKNQGQAKTSIFWNVVQSAFLLTMPITRVQVINFCNIEALGKQIRGCMTTILASVGFDKFSYWQMLDVSRQFVSSAMAEYMVDPVFFERFEARQARWAKIGALQKI